MENKFEGKDLIELIIDEDNKLDGIEAISIVEHPAIELDFVALSKTNEIKLAEVSNEKRILMGPALVPNKKIYRRIEDYEYYIHFSEETVRKASQLFLKQKNQSNSTLEHREIIEGLTVVESWIVEDTEKDKSALYDLNVPKGTWMCSIKVDNDEIWNDFVKTGKVKGFSIEGLFSNNLSRVQPELSVEELDELEALKIINDLKDLLKDE